MNPSRLPSNVGAALIAVFVLAATSNCDFEESQGIEADFTESTISQIIVPGYQKFEDSAEGVRGLVAALCDAPSTHTADAARAAWSEARGDWKHQQAFAFGPYREFPARFGFNIDLFPPRYSTIDEFLAPGQTVTATEIATMGTTARGLPVLEYLLFGGDIVEDSGRCQVALAVAEDLASLAGAMAASWADPQEGYAAQLLNGGGDFGSTHALFAEVLSRLGFTVEDIRRDRLNAPLGEDDASAAPESVESWPSGRSLADIRDSLRGVNEVFEGAAPDGVGLTDMLEFRRRADTVGAYRGAYADVLVKLAAVPEPLSDSILYERHTIVALEASLAELQRVIQVDIGNVLSASLTFNDADGD